jgi:steroid delta-isomerase
MPSPDQVRAAVESHVELFGAGDQERWVKLFAPEATVIDPVPAEPHRGHAAIGDFYEGIMAMADRVEVEQHALHVCGDQAALVYTLTLSNGDGGGMAFDGVELFTVDDDGLITLAQAYWDPAELRTLPIEG